MEIMIIFPFLRIYDLLDRTIFRETRKRSKAEKTMPLLEKTRRKTERVSVLNLKATKLAIYLFVTFFISIVKYQFVNQVLTQKLQSNTNSCIETDGICTFKNHGKWLSLINCFSHSTFVCKIMS